MHPPPALLSRALPILAFPQKLQELTAKVSALSTNGATGLTKATLGMALERAKASLDAQCQQDAKGLIDDVEATLIKKPESLCYTEYSDQYDQRAASTSCD